MQIVEYAAAEKRDYWLGKIGEAGWTAARYLHKLLSDGSFYDSCGAGSKVLLLTEGSELISFCTYAETDDIPDSGLSPWVGFVYTFPQFRGKRRIGKLIEHAYQLAKKERRTHLYISTDQRGLYEHFGFSFLRELKDRHGERSLVYSMPVEARDYSSVIGQTVRGRIDRPLGSSHPRHKDMIYPVNYGYVQGIMAADGAEQDVYVFGTDKPIASYEGKVIAVYHRLNDVEDKWIVSLDGKKPSDEEILRAIAFQEQYFMGELYS